MNGFSRRDFTIDVKMLLGINQCAASQIEDQRAVMFPGQVCQCFKGGRGHEACHGKVALMHLENHHRVVADSPPIIFQCGVIGGPYFAQSDACRFQDFRYSEASTNLDEFTSGKNHFGLRIPAGCHEDQHQGSSAVIDYGAGRGLTDRGQSFFHPETAFASLAGAQVQLQIVVAKRLENGAVQVQG